MMKWTLLLIILAAIVGKPTLAQSDDTLWFWAWRSYDRKVERAEDQRGDLLAFTPDGTVNVILKGVFPIVLHRIDENQAFVLGKIENTYTLYYLTSTQAIKVMELFDQDYMDKWRNYALYDGYPYFAPEIISAGENRFLIADRKLGQYLIFDPIKQNTTSLQNLHSWCNEECLRVSADGRYIRYRVSPIDPMHGLVFSDPGENALPYQIFEYDIETQTERLIYEQKSIDYIKGQAVPPHADCTPDQYGDRWYCGLFLDDAHNPIWVADEKLIIYTDGRIETVNPAWQLRVFDNKWYFLDLDTIRANCDRCVINVFPDGNEAKAFQFTVPAHEKSSFRYENVEMLSEQHLLVESTSRPFSALSRSGELTELGAPPCCADPISQDFYDKTTGWMIAINISDLDNPRTEIWNTRPLERIASLPVNIQPGVRSTFRDYSLVLFKGMSELYPEVVYSYFDDVMYEFDFDEPRGYLDAFPGGVLLVDYGDNHWVDPTYASTNDGMYRWTPTDGETLLIDGAIPIPNYW